MRARAIGIRFRRTSQTEHVSLALSPDGSTVYTSDTIWALTGAWYATIAYEA